MGGKGNKRVQVALRPPVLSLIEDYAKQQSISNSAAISRLVEEGLTRRGMLEASGGFAEVPMASESPDAVVMDVAAEKGLQDTVDQREPVTEDKIAKALKVLEAIEAVL